MRYVDCLFFFFNDTATTEIYTLSLHDALPISDDQLRGDAADDVEHPGEHHAVVPAAVQVEPRAVEDQRVDDAAAAPGVRPQRGDQPSGGVAQHDQDLVAVVLPDEDRKSVV